MKTAIAAIIVIILAIIGYFLFAPKTQAPVQNPAVPEGGTSAALETTNPNAPTETFGDKGGPVAAPKTVTVTYDGTSFSPSTVNLAQGDTVKFINNSSGSMWIASDPHPTHQGYSGTTASAHCPDTAGTAFDECATGTSYSFTFQKVGSWGYHNHTNHTARGTIVVAP